MSYSRHIRVFLLLLTAFCGPGATWAGTAGDHEPGSYVLAIEEEVKPFVLVRQGRNVWPSGRKGPGLQEVTWGVTQDWLRPNEKGSVSLLACSFVDEQAAQRAAQTYSVSHAAIFEQGGILGESFGNKSWHCGNDALVFSRGRFAFAVIARGITVEDQPLILVFARALDKKAQEATKSANPWELAPEKKTSDPSMPPPKAPASRGFDPEAIEAVLKGMSPEEARKYAVEKVQKLAENPDAELEKLRFFLRGLGPEEDPPQVRVLRQILRGTANDKVRAECLYVLGQWVTDSAEVRDDALRTLKEHVADADPRVRADVARAFGQSGDVRLLSLLAAFLQDQDASVRRSAGEGACRLLAWKRQIPSDEKEAEAWMADLRERLKPILEALSKFEEAAAAQRPPAPAPAPAPVE